NFAVAQSAAPSSRVVLEFVSGSQPLHDGVEVQSGAARLRITALRDDILRIRISPGADLPEDASWAVVDASRTKSIDVQPAQASATIGFRTAALDVRVERSPLRVVVRDLAGNIFCADAIGRPTEFSSGGFSVNKEMPGDARFFGLGDKIGTF